MYEQSEYWRGVNNAKARQAWAELLSSYSWDAFITCTPRNAALRSRSLSIIRRIRRCTVEDSEIVPSRLFVAAEEFRLGGWHGHGLVSWELGAENLDAGVQAYKLAERLSRIGFSRVTATKSNDAVAGYLSKYVIKDNPWEWEIAGSGWTHLKTSP